MSARGTAGSREPGTLRRRLVTLLALTVVLVALAIGLASTLVVRGTLTDSLDATLRDAQGRGARAVPTETTSGSWTPPPDDDAGRGRRGGPPGGLEVAGQQVGTIVVTRTGTGSLATTSAAYLGDDGRARTLDENQVGALVDAARPSPTTVEVPGMGTYRAVASADGTRVTALPMRQIDEVTRVYVLVEILVVAAAGLVAVAVGRALVARSLAPLERVAGVAERVATRPLAEGEVDLPERVAARDLTGSREVAHVGRALNALLGNVEESLSARHASETKVRRFVADASHELRTPLASVRGYTELVRRRDDALTPETAHALGRIESESLRMSALVEDLLLLARLDAGRELRTGEVDVALLAVDAVSDAHAAAPGHSWQLDLPDAEDDEADSPTTVIGDEDRLRQVLANLLTNARVHTPAGTTVHVAVRTTAESVRIVVEDDGPGVDPDLLPRLFDRFTRGDDSRARSADTAAGRSSGLGMSIVRAVVDAHGGTLTAENVTPHGLRAVVTLPRARG